MLSQSTLDSWLYTFMHILQISPSPTNALLYQVAMEVVLQMVDYIYCDCGFLSHFAEHRSATMFQLSLLDKVTTIVAVPDKGTVRDAVQPWVKKFGYDFDTIQLRYKQNFCVSW